jgi:hypothetical protein
MSDSAVVAFDVGTSHGRALFDRNGGNGLGAVALWGCAAVRIEFGAWGLRLGAWGLGLWA